MFPNTRRLTVCEFNMDAALIRSICSFGTLTELSLHYSSITDLEPDLRDLRGLTHLNVGLVGIEEGSAPLKVPAGLRHLVLDECDWADAAWFQANPLPLLATLSMRGCHIQTPRPGLLPLICERCPMLSTLNVQAGHVDSEPYEFKAPVNGTWVRDEDLDALAALPHLTSLSLCMHSTLAIAGLLRLRLLPALRSLDVRGTAVRREHADEMCARTPGLAVEYDSDSESDSDDNDSDDNDGDDGDAPM
jgi:Leucine-rich repeat (LRR) protein